MYIFFLKNWDNSACVSYCLIDWRWCISTIGKYMFVFWENNIASTFDGEKWIVDVWRIVCWFHMESRCNKNSNNISSCSSMQMQNPELKSYQILWYWLSLLFIQLLIFIETFSVAHLRAIGVDFWQCPSIPSTIFWESVTLLPPFCTT